jgi:hypothetical protein
MSIMVIISVVGLRAAPQKVAAVLAEVMDRRVSMCSMRPAGSDA